MRQSPPGDDEQSPPDDEKQSPYRLMMALFQGLKISLLYCLTGALLLILLKGEKDAQSFFMAYVNSFQTLLSLGLIIGTALIVYHSQDEIPETIEGVFSDMGLPPRYYTYRASFYSRSETMLLSGIFVVVAFAVFSFCHFPLSRPAEYLMLIAAGAGYGLGVYVGRKLLYTGLMLHSLLGTTITRNLFKHRELDSINSYVHIVSTLTVIFTYLTVIGYYQGPFRYNTPLGTSIKPFLLLPAVIAIPVLLLFNFYPRAVLRKLYGQSIEIEIKQLQETLHVGPFSEFEKLSHVMEVQRMSHDELRYNLQLTLGDLPIGITILVMILQPFLSR